MATKDPRIDAYIAKARPFAQPILAHLRAVVHAACPAVEEGMKWSFPHFSYRGEILCSMAAFKAHCAFGFWKGAQVTGATRRDTEGMGHLGRIASLDDLPSTAKLTTLIKRAMRLNEAGVKREVARQAAPKRALATPPALLKALKANAAARATFDGFPPSQRREYITWITEARTDTTRDRRIAQAVEWMAEGKVRNWKYVK